MATVPIGSAEVELVPLTQVARLDAVDREAGAPGRLLLDLGPRKAELPRSLQELRDLEAFAADGWVPEKDLLDLERVPGHGILVRDVAARRLLVVARRVVLQLSQPEPAAEALPAGLDLIRRLPFADGLVEARWKEFDGSLDRLSADLRELSRRAEVLMVEPVVVEHLDLRSALAQPPAPPQDPDLPLQFEQWDLIGVREAWRESTGSGVGVAVLDRGFAARHRDLLLSPHSGYFDADDNFFQSLDGMPNHTHGTECAGMVAARGNSLGGRGVAWQSDLTCIQIGALATASQLGLALAVFHAVAGSELSGYRGADCGVVTCSLGPRDSPNRRLTRVLDLALDYARDHGRGGKGALVFWAVSHRGNADLDEVLGHEIVQSVAAVDASGSQLVGASGATLDFVAPGLGVATTKSTSCFGSYQGSPCNETNLGFGLAFGGPSLAAPAAAGIAALVLGKHPELSWEQLRDVLRGASDQADSPDTKRGYGLPNAVAALDLAGDLA